MNNQDREIGREVVALIDHLKNNGKSDSEIVEIILSVANDESDFSDHM